MNHFFKRFTCVFVLFAAALLTSGCGMSNEEIGKGVKASMQETIDTDADFEGIPMTVKDLTVVESKDGHKGIAEIELDGKTYSVSVDIIVDGTSFLWETGPNEWDFAIEWYNQKYVAPEIADSFEQAYEDSFRESFRTSFKESCAVSGGGSIEVRLACDCIAVNLIEEYSVAELSNVAFVQEKAKELASDCRELL